MIRLHFSGNITTSDITLIIFISSNRRWCHQLTSTARSIWKKRDVSPCPLTVMVAGSHHFARQVIWASWLSTISNTSMSSLLTMFFKGSQILFSSVQSSRKATSPAERLSEKPIPTRRSVFSAQTTESHTSLSTMSSQMRCATSAMEMEITHTITVLPSTTSFLSTDLWRSWMKACLYTSWRKPSHMLTRMVTL